MTDNQKFISGLLLGAGLVLFLTSAKGKELIREIKEGANQAQDDLQNKLQEFDTAMNELLEKGKSFINELEKKTDTTA